MNNVTTPECVADAATPYFMPMLLKTEDFDAFEADVAQGTRKIGALCLKSCLETFDRQLRRHVPHSWSLHEVNSRTLITLLGAVTYERSVYLDEYGRRRIWLDEILGIPKRTRLSAGAFLWIVRRAAEQSYRKTAAAFAQLTGEKISHVCVMDCVHKEGALLKNAPPRPPGVQVSQDEIFTEVDGLWIHLQNSTHRDRALPRFLYEQARKATSFELKMACIYAGKKKVAAGRYKRGNLDVVVADEAPDSFWERVVEQIGVDYEIDDIERIWAGHDGGAWCGTQRISELMVDTKAQVTGSLDPFHVMKYITHAFPEGAKRDWAIHLACKGKGMRLARMSERIAAKMKTGPSKDSVVALAKYAKNNSSDIRFPKRTMGTMEATCYHVGAKRCKNNATAWSRRGAEAMCLIRAAIQTGRSLIAPCKGALFTAKEEQKKKIAQDMFTSATIPLTTGSGYEMPLSHVALSKYAAISLARRS